MLERLSQMLQVRQAALGHEWLGDLTANHIFVLEEVGIVGVELARPAPLGGGKVNGVQRLQFPSAPQCLTQHLASQDSDLRVHFDDFDY